jgi:DMSO/TMAO reductase YedYZ molybdopterin-dependent catalytic subunit
MTRRSHGPSVLESIERRRFLQAAARGTTLLVLGGVYAIADEARAETRADGRERVPPGQRVITALKPMGGEPGDPAKSKYRLRVHGEVGEALDLDFRTLLGMKPITQDLDVHCVTGWTVLGARWTGVRLSTLAKAAQVKDTAKHVIFEGAHGYTANVPIKEALADSVMIAWELDDVPIAGEHGSPVRAVVPDLYFWKSSKWLTGLKFVRNDEPGYWETRGYHNHADPWKEERYS